MAKVVALGEMLTRLSPMGFQRLVQASQFQVNYGGSEANAMISLTQMGVDTAYVTRLPDNPLGEAARNTLRRWGVNTDHVLPGDGRMGIYYLEQGAAVRASNVYYDRAESAMAKASSDMFNWDDILKGAQWLHFSGITPALSAGCAAIAMEAIQKAKAMGVKVCCDLNYRAKLWPV